MPEEHTSQKEKVCQKWNKTGTHRPRHPLSMSDPNNHRDASAQASSKATNDSSTAMTASRNLNATATTSSRRRASAFVDDSPPGFLPAQDSLLDLLQAAHARESAETRQAPLDERTNRRRSRPAMEGNHSESSDPGTPPPRRRRRLIPRDRLIQVMQAACNIVEEIDETESHAAEQHY